MMITIMLENPGDWVMMGESRPGGCIKSAVRNFIAGPLADVDKGDRRFTKSRLASSFFHQAYNTYVLYPFSPKETTKDYRPIEQTPHRRSWGHI